MAIPVQTGEMWRLRTRYLLENQVCENVNQFIATTPSDDVLLRLVVVWIQCFTAHILPSLPSIMTLDTVRYQRVTAPISIEFIEPFPANTVGTGNGLSLPSFCSRVVSIQTSLGGRSHHGRIYFPGIPEDQTQNSILEQAVPGYQAFLDFLACLVTKFIVGEPIGQNQFKLGVYSRKLGGAKLPYNTVGFTQAEKLSLATFIGTTRSRKVGRGQ